MNKSSVFYRICRINEPLRCVIILSIMGQIIIEIPQDGTHVYEIHNTERVKKLLSVLEQIAEIEKDEEEDILGLWTTPEPFKRTAKQ